MISSFLRSMTRRCPSSKAAMSPVLQPALGVDGFGAGSPPVAVAGHHQRTAHQRLVIIGELDLGAGQRRADPAGPDVVRRGYRDHAGGLRHSVDLPQRDPERGKEFDDARRARRRPVAPPAAAGSRAGGGSRPDRRRRPPGPRRRRASFPTFAAGRRRSPVPTRKQGGHVGQLGAAHHGIAVRNGQVVALTRSAMWAIGR